MIVVDSSVWINFFNGHADRAKDELKRLLAFGGIELLVPDLVLFEVLRGFRLERDFRQANQLLRALSVVPTGGVALAHQAAQHYRSLRAAGYTVRSPIDILLATYCIAHDHLLLHADADFHAMQRLLGLKVLEPA
jgi:predicted nucleic acid-binding protein